MRCARGATLAGETYVSGRTKADEPKKPGGQKVRGRVVNGDADGGWASREVSTEHHTVTAWHVTQYTKQTQQNRSLSRQL